MYSDHASEHVHSHMLRCIPAMLSASLSLDSLVLGFVTEVAPWVLWPFGRVEVLHSLDGSAVLAWELWAQAQEVQEAQDAQEAQEVQGAQEAQEAQEMAKVISGGVSCTNQPTA